MDEPTTAEQHVRNIINTVEPWDIVGFGPNRRLSAGEVVGGANYLVEHFIGRIEELEKQRSAMVRNLLELLSLLEPRIESGFTIRCHARDLSEFEEALGGTVAELRQRGIELVAFGEGRVRCSDE